MKALPLGGILVTPTIRICGLNLQTVSQWWIVSIRVLSPPLDWLRKGTLSLLETHLVSTRFRLLALTFAIGAGFAFMGIARANASDDRYTQSDERLDINLEIKEQVLEVQSMHSATGRADATEPTFEEDTISDYRGWLLDTSEDVFLGETLPDLLLEAFSNSPDVLLRRSELEAAGYDLSAAKWARYPSLSADVELPDSDENVATVRLEQSLWTGGRITGQIDSAKADEEVAKAAFEEQRLSTMLDLTSTYYEVVRLKARFQIGMANESEHRRLLDIIERRVAANVSAQADQTQAQARFQQAVRDRIAIEQQIATAMSRIERIVARPVRELVAPREVQFGNRTAASLIRQSLEYSPALKRLTAQIEASKAQVEVTKSNKWPQLVLGMKSTSASDTAAVDDDESVYLSFRVQTGAGLSNLSEARAAASRAEVSTHELLAEQHELRRQIQSLWVEYRGLSAQIEPARALQAASAEIIASYLRQFQVGRKTWLDVLNAQREKTAASAAMADIEYTLMNIKTQLLILAGEITVTNMEHIL